ncbi:hypothetical protein ACQV2F_23515, partial [Pantoea allii]|uniref:hypothetical protein n=1 Tax=Pantoea allii TaxID=574096 RepID=UPI003D3180B5
GLTFADVLSAHPEILHPLSGTGRPAHSPALIPVPKLLSASLQMSENIASDARKASHLIAVHFFIFVRLPCLQF